MKNKKMKIIISEKGKTILEKIQEDTRNLSKVDCGGITVYLRPMSETIFKCKCGAEVTKESGIIGTDRRGNGRMVIRCKDHITESAIRNLANKRDRMLARAGISVQSV